MKRRKLIALTASIFFILVLLVTGCTQAAAPKATTPNTTPQSSVDRTYNVMNPEGLFVPVQTSSLAPRLDTIEGKTIYVWQGESDPVIGPALYPLLQKLYPKTNWKYVGVSGTGLSAPEDEVLGKVEGQKKADALMRLNGW